MSDTWSADAERFNKFHAPAGSATGGQFASGSGGGAKGKDTRPTPTNAHPVGQGETSKRVSDLQERLNAGGFKPPLKVDGIFGPKTLAAVRAFQKAHGLKVDGLVGPKTTAALRAGHPAAQHHAAHPAMHAPAMHAPARTTPVKAAQRASDLKYGHGSALWKYWTVGEGHAKWSGAVHKWTTLRDLLLKAGVPAISADGLTTNIIMAVMPGYMKQAHSEHKAGRSGMAEQDVMDRPAASASRAEYMRLYALEDIHILRSADGGDGRTVEAYAAVFGEPAEIVDHEGHYVEVIDPAAFNRAIDHASRARGGFPGSVKVLWNHGRDLSGAASDRFSMPIGIPVDIRAEARGLLTRTRYSETPLADEVLENIRAGSITSQSFTGRIMRSDPQLRRGDRYRPDSAGNLRTVTRTELGLREYGPVLWPAYSGAEIVGVRMSTPGAYALDPDELDEGTPPDEGSAAGDPLTRADGEEHSARYHQHALYVLRAKEARERAGLVW
jgi:HK97 family phage prohead protease